jgi:Uma2 family endonuclease
MSVDEYLASEQVSTVKHEYVGGVQYAMVGARNAHNRIAGNAFGALWNRLSGKPCQPCNSDTKIRLQLPGETRFYYPDLSVTCQPNAQSDPFEDAPAVVLEVLSKGTRRIDQGEKKDAYLTIKSLVVYVLVEQEAACLEVWRRTAQGFVREQYEGLDAVLPLPEIGATLPLSDLYGGVEFIVEPD